MIELIVLAVVIIAIGIGIYLGNSGNSDPVRPGDNRGSDECDQACIQWQARKSELCDAERAEADAKERVDLFTQLVTAVGAGTVSIVVALIGAAALAALFAEFGIPAAVAAALLAGGVAVAILGGTVTLALAAALLTATLIWNGKQQDTSAAETAESEARGILNNACTQDEISTCLANSPC